MIMTHCIDCTTPYTCTPAHARRHRKSQFFIGEEASKQTTHLFFMAAFYFFWAALCFLGAALCLFGAAFWTAFYFFGAAF